MLAVITPSRATSLASGISALASASGLLIAVAGRLSADDAAQLAASRRGNAPAMALLLAVSAWTSDGTARTRHASAEILSAAGWRVVVASAARRWRPPGSSCTGPWGRSEPARPGLGPGPDRAW